jgi:uncharacterized protein with GYD domain
MPTFIMTGTWTDQGIRAVKEVPKRAQAARDLAKKLGVEIKQVYLTSGRVRPFDHCGNGERRQHP